MKNLYGNLPDSPGVYLFKDKKGGILYIGKAGNLRRRVASYFERPHDYKIERLVNQIKKIDYEKTDTAIEALILESRLIKKHEPAFNVKEKDNKSFLYVEITKDKFPRVLLSRSRDLALSRAEGYGPFTSASSIRESLRIIRRIFPFSVHDPSKIGKFERPCFEYELGLCSGTCIGAISRMDYLKNIKNIKLFFEGKKKKIITNLSAEMNRASKKTDFEKAEKLRRQIFSLQHIQDVALINEPETYSLSLTPYNFRIEGYDVSNISGTSAVGAMVVFINGKPDKNEYRKFKIRTISAPNDVGMLKEVLSRRFSRLPTAGGWLLPDLILVDGGQGQVNVAKNILAEFGLKIPVLGIAKGPKRNKNEFIGKIPSGIAKDILIRLRNEAHRFAISYHKEVRSRESGIS